VTIAPRVGVDLKIARARHHLTDLERDTRAYLDGDPFPVYTEAGPSSGPLIFRVRIRDEVPAELAVVLGHALHNARSALDHVACRLVEANRRSIDRTQFPTGTTKSNFLKEVDRRLDGASQDVKAAVRALAAYQGGDEQLVRLLGLALPTRAG
jgi:hypothetical protein